MYQLKMVRGKSKKTGAWVYGGYLPFWEVSPSPMKEAPEPKHIIASTGLSDWNIPGRVKVFEVDPDTVSQNTGLKLPPKGIPLHEGDLLEFQEGMLNEGFNPEYGVIEFDLGAFWVRELTRGKRRLLYMLLEDDPMGKRLRLAGTRWDKPILQLREYPSGYFSIVARVWTPEKNFYEHPEKIGLSREEAEESWRKLEEEGVSLPEVLRDWEWIGS